MRGGAVLVAIGIVMWVVVLGGVASGGDDNGGEAGANDLDPVAGSTATAPDAPPEETPSEPEAPEPTETPEAAPEPESDVHVVEAGDTMARIAALYDVSLQDLLNANSDLENPSDISVGQEINLPD